ncbi:hypothetical protein FAN83_22390 [Klebsiella pneumoniae subsp. pneumoniae]|nr:hypothetical protein FAN83_22390 [Klebsiella pneumoniae subsp. pneumoniae]
MQCVSRQCGPAARQPRAGRLRKRPASTGRPAGEMTSRPPGVTRGGGGGVPPGGGGGFFLGAREMWKKKG